MQRPINRLSINRLFLGMFVLVIGSQAAFASAVLANFQTVPERSKVTFSQTAANKGRTAFSDLEEELDLTEAQAEEIEAIQADMIVELESILSADQLETFTAARANGDDMRSVLRGLGLSSSQRSELMSVSRETESQIMDVLTPDQRAQLEGASPRDRN